VVAPIAIVPGASAAARDVPGRYRFARAGGTWHMRRGPAAARDRTRIWGQASYAVG
jgi:hypothetical protein